LVWYSCIIYINITINNFTQQMFINKLAIVGVLFGLVRTSEDAGQNFLLRDGRGAGAGVIGTGDDTSTPVAAATRQLSAQGIHYCIGDEDDSGEDGGDTDSMKEQRRLTAYGVTAAGKAAAINVLAA
jgi:hypothetical protein